MKYQSIHDVELVIKVMKESQSGITSNERLLLIKAGIISYFSSAPKHFSGTVHSLQMSGELPKFTISAADLQKVKCNEGELKLSFKKSKLIDKKALEDMVRGKEEEDKKSSTDDNSIQKWVFKSDKKDLVKQFYNQIMLCRTNAKFKPQLSNMLIGYRMARKGQRQMSMLPSVVTPTHSDRKRMSQVPTLGSSNDKFDFNSQKEKKTENKTTNLVKQDNLNGRDTLSRISFLNQQSITSIEESELEQNDEESENHEQQIKNESEKVNKFKKIKQEHLQIAQQPKHQQPIKQAEIPTKTQKEPIISNSSSKQPIINDTSIDKIPSKSKVQITEIVKGDQIEIKVSKDQKIDIPAKIPKQVKQIAQPIYLPVDKIEPPLKNKPIQPISLQPIALQQQKIKEKDHQIIKLTEIPIVLAQSQKIPIQVEKTERIDIQDSKLNIQTHQIQEAKIEILKQQQVKEQKVEQRLEKIIDSQQRVEKEQTVIELDKQQKIENCVQQNKEKQESIVQRCEVQKEIQIQVPLCIDVIEKLSELIQDSSKIIESQIENKQYPKIDNEMIRLIKIASISKTMPQISQIYNIPQNVLIQINNQQYENTDQTKDNNDKNQPEQALWPLQIDKYHKLQSGKIDSFEGILHDSDDEIPQIINRQITIIKQNYENYSDILSHIIYTLQHVPHHRPANNIEYKYDKFKIRIDAVKYSNSNNQNQSSSSFSQLYAVYCQFQRVLQKLKSLLNEEYEYKILEVIYVKVSNMECIAIQQCEGNAVPLQSVKSLLLFSKSKDMNIFHQMHSAWKVFVYQTDNTVLFQLQNTQQSITTFQEINKYSLQQRMPQIQIYQQTNEFKLMKDQIVSKLNMIVNKEYSISEDNLSQLIAQLQEDEKYMQIVILCKILRFRYICGQITLIPTIQILSNKAMLFNDLKHILDKHINQNNLFQAKKVLYWHLIKFKAYHPYICDDELIQAYLKVAQIIILTQEYTHAIDLLITIKQQIGDYDLKNYQIYMLLLKLYCKIKNKGQFIAVFQNCKLYVRKVLKSSICFQVPLHRLYAVHLIQMLQETKAEIVYNECIQKAKGIPLGMTAVELQMDLAYLYLKQSKYRQAFVKSRMVSDQLNSVSNLAYEAIICMAKSWLHYEQSQILQSMIVQQKLFNSFCNLLQQYKLQHQEHLSNIFSLIITVLNKLNHDKIPSKIQKIDIYCEMYKKSREIDSLKISSAWKRCLQDESHELRKQIHQRIANI